MLMAKVKNRNSHDLLRGKILYSDYNFYVLEKFDLAFRQA